MKLPVYRVIAETTGKDARIVTTLFETTKRHEFDTAKHKIGILVGEVVQRRICRPVEVLAVDEVRFAKFSKVRLRPGVYSSVQSLAVAMEANPATLRVALSKAGPHRLAKLRGADFRYRQD